MNLSYFIQPEEPSLIDKAKDQIEKTAQSEGLLGHVLIHTSRFTLTVWDVIVIAFVILLTFLLLKIIRRAFLRNKRIDIGKRYSLYNLTRYVLIVMAFIWTLDFLGVKLTLLLGGSAALLVGIGLGLQNLFSDFVSGVILLVDSSIKVGDVIDVEGLVCQVTKINLRTTQVLTRDDKYILLPNTLLTKNRIINWTHNSENSRFEVSVGVDYGSDIDRVMKVMYQACAEQEGVDKEPEPFVRFNDFGDSSLLFTAYFWSSNVFRVENVKSEIRQKIFRKFRENDISIPFPQRVLHINSEHNELSLSDRQGGDTYSQDKN